MLQRAHTRKHDGITGNLRIVMGFFFFFLIMTKHRHDHSVQTGMDIEDRKKSSEGHESSSQKNQRMNSKNKFWRGNQNKFVSSM